MLTSRVAKANIRPFEAGGHKCLARDQGHERPAEADGKIARIRKKINARPREKLNFMTPAEYFFKNIS